VKKLGILLGLVFIGLTTKAQVSASETLSPAVKDIDVSVKMIETNPAIKQLAWNQYVTGTEQAVLSGLALSGVVASIVSEAAVSVAVPIGGVALAGYLIWRSVDNRKIYKAYKQKRRRGVTMNEIESIEEEIRMLNSKKNSGTSLTKEERYRLYDLEKLLKKMK